MLLTAAGAGVRQPGCQGSETLRLRTRRPCVPLMQRQVALQVQRGAVWLSAVCYCIGRGLCCLCFGKKWCPQQAMQALNFGRVHLQSN